VKGKFEVWRHDSWRSILSEGKVRGVEARLIEEYPECRESSRCGGTTRRGVFCLAQGTTRRISLGSAGLIRSYPHKIAYSRDLKQSDYAARIHFSTDCCNVCLDTMLNKWRGVTWCDMVWFAVCVRRIICSRSSKCGSKLVNALLFMRVSYPAGLIKYSKLCRRFIVICKEDLFK
jgi:hypothetical protein